VSTYSQRKEKTARSLATEAMFLPHAEEISSTALLHSDLFCSQLFHDDVRPDESIYKGPVPDRIHRVANGVDEFQKYLNNTGEDAKNQAATTRRQSANSANTGTRENQARQTKDDLEDALDDLNRSTNRLRRKFDATSNYLETKKTSANRWARILSGRRRIRVTRNAEIHWRRDRPQRENDNPPTCLGRSCGLAGG
jgi:hypothetical protein